MHPRAKKRKAGKRRKKESKQHPNTAAARPLLHVVPNMGGDGEIESHESEEVRNGEIGDDHLTENDNVEEEEEEENGDGDTASHPPPVRTESEEKPNGRLNDSETHHPYEMKDSCVDSVKNREVQMQTESVEQNGRSEGGVEDQPYAVSLVEETPTDDSIEIAAEEDIPVEKISPGPEASPLPVTELVTDEIIAALSPECIVVQEGVEAISIQSPIPIPVKISPAAEASPVPVTELVTSDEIIAALSPECIVVQEGVEAISIQPPIFCPEIVDEHDRETPMDDSVKIAAEEGIPIPIPVKISPVPVTKLVTDEIGEKTCGGNAALSPECVKAISIQSSSPKILYVDIVDGETPIDDDSVKKAAEEGIPVDKPLLEPEKTTFWNGCCGLFEVFRGSGRRNSW